MATWLETLVRLLRRVRRSVHLSGTIAVGTGLVTSGVPRENAAANTAPPVVAATVSRVSRYAKKFVLRPFGQTGMSFRLAGHGSHSSHASHASHASHYSGSGPSTPPPSPPQPPPPPPPPPPPAPVAPPVTRTEPATPPGVYASPTVLTFGALHKAGRSRPLTWTRGSRLFDSAFLDGRTEVEQDAEHLTMRPPANAQTSHFAGYYSASAMNLTGVVASIGVRPAIGGALTNFALVIDQESWYAFAVANDTLVFVSREHGALSSTNVPLDLLANRYWRFRHDAATNVLFWETRGESGAWQVRHALTPQTPLSTAAVELSVGTSPGVADPGTASFDALIVTLRKH